MRWASGLVSPKEQIFFTMVFAIVSYAPPGPKRKRNDCSIAVLFFVSEYAVFIRAYFYKKVHTFGGVRVVLFLSVVHNKNRLTLLREKAGGIILKILFYLHELRKDLRPVRVLCKGNLHGTVRHCLLLCKSIHVHAEG